MRITKRSQQFVTFLKQNLTTSKAVVVLHDNPDPDTLAAGLCLKKIFENAYKVPTTIVYGGIVGRAENRKMVQACGIQAQKVRNYKEDSDTFVAVVDTQPGVGNNVLEPTAKVDVVVDHHPRVRSTWKMPWVDVRPKYGATATIALEYLLAHNLELTKPEATALLYALKSETQDLGREASVADRRAYFYLFPKSDFNVLFQIANAEVTREYFQVLARALENAKIHNNVLVSALGEIEIADYVAEVADMLLRLKGVNWTFVLGRFKGAMILSMRTLQHDSDAGMVMKQVVEGLGTGGGHEMMAGGRIDEIKEVDGAEPMEEELSSRFLRALRKRSKGQELLDGPPANKPPQ